MRTLRSSIDAVELLNTAAGCIGEVILYTAAGDEIDLKSELSKYVFLMAAAKPDMLEDAKVTLSADQDLELMERFFTE